MPVAGGYKAEDFESAIADIQLFSSQEQVELAHQFAASASRGEFPTLDPLLNALRDDLRKELNLGKVEKAIRPFRIVEKERTL